MAFASIDLPVPGLPIIMTCRRWVAAFLMTSTARSWPMTWSISFAGTSIWEDAPSTTGAAGCAASGAAAACPAAGSGAGLTGAFSSCTGTV